MGSFLQNIYWNGHWAAQNLAVCKEQAGMNPEGWSREEQEEQSWGARRLKNLVYAGESLSKKSQYGRTGKITKN